MSEYLWINLLTISLPLLATFNKRLCFHKTWFALWPALAITAVLFIVWDIYFTSFGIWGFNSTYLAGYFVLGLPVEEWLFFITIPYACVFTYFCTKKFIKFNISTWIINFITVTLAFFLIIVGLFNLGRIYTSATFILTGIFLLIHRRLFRAEYLPHFFLAYLVIFLGPFFLVNGFLTGLFTPDPIVWYNGSMNIGIRVFTIPLEDFIYGMLLYLVNVTIYEKLLSSTAITATKIATLHIQRPTE